MHEHTTIPFPHPQLITKALSRKPEDMDILDFLLSRLHHGPRYFHPLDSPL